MGHQNPATPLTAVYVSFDETPLAFITPQIGGHPQARPA
jgi:hypothetical protein